MTEIRPRINYEIGEVYPFTVTRIYDNFCELSDADNFKVYLQGTNKLMLVRGQRIRCRVLQNYKKRPKIEIVDVGYVVGEKSKVSEATVVELLRELGADWAVDELATLLMSPDRGGSFEDDCLHWISQLRRAGVALDQVERDCTQFVECSRFLALCNPVERQLYQQRLSSLVELLGCNVEADRLLREQRAPQFVDELLAKLRLSGFVFRPMRNFNVLSSLFLLDPALMEDKVLELFEVLRRWNPEMWLEEPLNGVLTKLVQLYIDRDIWSVDHRRGNQTIVATLLQALTISLKLMGQRTDDDLYRLNLSRLSTLSTYSVKARGDQMLALSLSNLLATNAQLSPYSWADTASQRVPILLSQIVPNPIDTESTFIFGRGKLTIARDLFALELGKGEKPREALPKALGLWGGLHVIADRDLLHPLTSNPSIVDCKRFWENLERAVFEPEPKVSPATASRKKRHHVGDFVQISIFRQDTEDPTLFSAQIEDEQGGEGFIQTDQIVPYTIKANITHFRWPNGHRMIFDAEIIDVDDDGLFRFSMLNDIKHFVNETYLEEDQEVLVSMGKELPPNIWQPWPGVTDDGISASITGLGDITTGGLRKGHLLRARYRSEGPGTYVIECKAIGRVDGPIYNDMQEAFRQLMEAFAIPDKQDEPEHEEFEKSDRILDPTFVRELIRIIDRMAVLDNEYVKSYNYLGFARLLCLLIGWKEQADYYRGRMELIVMLHDYAKNDVVDKTRLRQLADTNAELIDVNPQFHDRFLLLKMVSYMRNSDDDQEKTSERDQELWDAYNSNENQVKDVASLVIAYNMVRRNNMHQQAIDIHNRIKKTLRLDGYESGLKIYGSGIEDLHTEYKTSIVFPPNNNMMPDLDKQLHNILGVIAGFLNSEGGTLYIGVNDVGAGVGLESDLAFDYFHGDKDKYQRTIVDAVCLTWGNATAVNYLEVGFDKENPDKDVLIVTVRPSRSGVFFDGKCPVRTNSSSRGLTSAEFQEYNRNTRNMEPAAATDTPQEPQEEPVQEAEKPTETPATLVTTSDAEKIATSQNRNNILHDWEEGYVGDHIGYIKLTDGKFAKTEIDDYDETLLTLAVHEDEEDAYLVLGYDDGTMTKVPMREILRMEDNRSYNRFTGAQLVFASIATDDDMLVSLTDEDKKTRSRHMVRVDHIANIEPGKLAQRGSRLWNDGISRPGVRYEVIPSRAGTEPLKGLLDRDARSLGMPLATSPAETKDFLKRHGVE